MKVRYIVIMLLLIAVQNSIQRKRGKSREPKKRCATPGRCSTIVERVTPETSYGDAFYCLSCHKVHCQTRNPDTLDCRGGKTTDFCGCCPKCAKIEGEQCGGRYNYLGKCDTGLRCEREPPPAYLLPRGSAPVSEIATPPPSGSDWKGRCRRATVLPDVPGLSSQVCKDECTAEFCMANPKAICSARNNAIEEQDCQEKCQHTSCSACFFQEEPQCPKCRTNDFACIKKFAKCTRKKSTCTRNKYPCKKTKKPQSGKFLCWVPKCL